MKEFRVRALWRWPVSIGGSIVALLILAVLVVSLLPSDSPSPQTASQKFWSFVIFLAIAVACALAPWYMWTGRLWLSDSMIKLRFGFATKEAVREQIHHYSIEGGVRLGAIPVQPGWFVLYAADNKPIVRIPLYFEGRGELQAWVDQVVAGRAARVTV